MKKRKNKLAVGKKELKVKNKPKQAVKKRKNKPLQKKDRKQIISSYFRKNVKKPFLYSIENARKHIILFFEYIRMKRVNAVAKMHYDIGNEELDLAKKKAKKEHGDKIVEEFEKMSKETEKQTKPMPRKALLLRVFMYKRIKRNLLKLFHPIRMLRKSRKTKTLAYTDSLTEVNKK
jgi:hypothetical protein